LARKRIIEGTWECTSCETTDIKGRHKTCPACGNPREKAESDFNFGARTESGASTAATVSTPDLLHMASAGEDWMCANCDASNPGDRDACRTCAARRHDPFGEPVVNPVEQPAGKNRGLKALLATATAAITGAMAILASCCGVSWYASDAIVDAEITGQQWVRQIDVQRLTASDVQQWRDALPAPAGVPGSGALSAGLGVLGDCETLACWPRPPAEGGLVRVTGRQWERTIVTKVMDSSAETGWRSAAPRSRGERPRNGVGGRHGHHNLSCSERVKTPEECRDEDYQEACGTHEECSVRDLGNGFAEETCVDVQDYCTQTHEVCTAAVMGEWCSWNDLSWKEGRTRSTSGRDANSTWPLMSLRSDEVEERTEQYFLDVAVLAGRADPRSAVPKPVYMSASIGRLMYRSPSGFQPVPHAVQTSDTHRHDCGDGIAFGVLTTRDRCDAQVYGWVDEDPQRAQSPSGAPEWPDGQLSNDGRETRTEWMLIELSWKRGNKPGHAVFKDPVAQWQAWDLVQSIPMVVDFDATYVSLGDDYQGPVPSEVRPGRLSQQP
jgi:hypothetical protein